MKCSSISLFYKIFPLVVIAAVANAGDANAPSGPIKNVLLICIDDLRPELKSFGATYIHSPNIDQLAAEGRAFLHHYVNAPSCGPSRFTLLTGNYGSADNYAIFKRAAALKKNPDAFPPSMPEWFRQHGFTTVSIGKVSHHPGGRGGKDWDDDNEIEMPNAWDRHLMPSGAWQHPRGIMHGLANGEIRGKSGEMVVFQSEPGDDSIYPDGMTTNEALNQIDLLAKDKQKPFFLAVGIIRPHLPFGAPKKYLDLYKDVKLPPIPHPEKPSGKTTWHNSGEFMKYNRWGKNPNTDAAFADDVRLHYAACVSYADAQVGRLRDKLKEMGVDKNTMIIIWGDHGWHLGEYAIWGKHSLFEEALHSPLIIYHPNIENPGQPTTAVVETADIFPTLCELMKIPAPPKTTGTSLTRLISNPKAEGRPALSYWGSSNTIRTEQYRLVLHKDNAAELYDFSDPQKESINIAQEKPEVVQELTKLLKERAALK